ncbi:MAG: hypothetical protein AB8B65_09080 [Kordia sp.]|uniref:hypothetical protein n=1 Tax=Kordia sp. TaxID=1965332 RepID=UPI00385F7F0B
MKKKEFDPKLKLGKKVISSLETYNVQGGTEVPSEVPTEPIKTKKTKRTAHDACTIIATCYCSLTCPEKCDEC